MNFTEKKLNRIIKSGVNFAVDYSIPILVLDQLNKSSNIATGIIIRTDSGAVLATAGHVIDEFVRLGVSGRMQIGDNGYVLKNIPKNRINILSDIDFGTINLTEEDIRRSRWQALSIRNVHFGGVRQMDLVAYVGFPGCWKQLESERVMNLGRLCCVGAIETVEMDQFSIRIDKDRYELEAGIAGQLTEAGGISGAPVFSLFDFHDSRIRDPLLVGWIHEGFVWDDLAQKHYAVQACAVRALLDGSAS